MGPDARSDLEEWTGSESGAAPDGLRYLAGFGNELAERGASTGVLPQGQNAPQHPPRGLYTEQISGTPFTAPRAENRRSWLYRIRPSAMHPPFRRIDNGLLRTAPCAEAEPPPNRLRWSPLPFPPEPSRFRRRPRDARQQRRRGFPHRHRDPRLPRHPFDDRPGILQCRRRTPDRAAAGPPAAAHRVRPARGLALASSRSSRAA